VSKGALRIPDRVLLKREVSSELQKLQDGNGAKVLGDLRGARLWLGMLLTLLQLLLQGVEVTGKI